MNQDFRMYMKSRSIRLVRADTVAIAAKRFNLSYNICLGLK